MFKKQPKPNYDKNQAIENSPLVQKLAQYTYSFLKVFFFLNFFLIAAIGSCDMNILFLEKNAICKYQVEIYMVSAIILSVFLNSTLFKWENTELYLSGHEEK